MLFKFRIKSDIAEKFMLHIDADANNTFYQLHEAIQEECKYDPSQLATFFLADEEWDKDIEIKMFGTKSSHSETSDGLLMKKTINAPVLTLSKGIAPVQILGKNADNNLIVKDDPDFQNVFDDLGELEDLNEIYGEMSNIL